MSERGIVLAAIAVAVAAVVGRGWPWWAVIAAAVAALPFYDPSKRVPVS